MGFCDRKAVFEHAGVEKNPMDAQTLRTFWMGNQIHAALQQKATETMEVIGHELEFEGTINDAKIRGRLDSLVLNDGIREVVEFKSASGLSWRYGGRPKREHLLQVGCYLMFSPICNREWHSKEAQQTQLEMDLGCDLCSASAHEPAGILPLPERARLVYWNKDTAQMEEYIVQPTEALFDAVRAEVDRLESLYQSYVTGKIPPGVVREKGAGKDPWQWNWCPYANRGCCGDK